MPNELSNEVLETLQQVHEKMKQRMMLHPEYCAMVALEKSIASISEILHPAPVAADDDVSVDDEHELEDAIAETVAAKIAPAQPRIAPAAFLPMPRVGGQAVGMR